VKGSNWIELCSFNEIPDGAAIGFDPFGRGRDALFLVRRGETLKAYRNVCPHQGASLPWRKNAYLNPDASRIVCSAHGAQFDIDTGRCLLGAALGQSLETITTSIAADGTVRVCLGRDL